LLTWRPAQGGADRLTGDNAVAAGMAAASCRIVRSAPTILLDIEVADAISP
jgi:hypothetical protein